MLQRLDNCRFEHPRGREGESSNLGGTRNQGNRYHSGYDDSGRESGRDSGREGRRSGGRGGGRGGRGGGPRGGFGPRQDKRGILVPLRLVFVAHVAQFNQTDTSRTCNSCLSTLSSIQCLFRH